MWLIVTHHKLMGITLSPDTYHEYSLTGSEIDQLRIINPSKLRELLQAWHPHAPLKTISLAFTGVPIYEQYNTSKMPTGFITDTCTLSTGAAYTAGIPSELFVQYHCVLHALGISLQTITTLTLVLDAAQQPVASAQALIAGCKRLNETV